ncbi:MAG: hypothetical protein IJO76_01940, partial [Clostridia bacterium]|nr:hypothetical protein [Clostridia bacterium]
MFQTKKVLAVVLAALLVLLAMPMAAFADTAENAATTYVDGKETVSAYRGDTVTVTVNVTAAATTTLSVSFGESFDSNAFTFVSAEWLLTDGVLSDVDKANGHAVITFENAVDLNGAAFRYVLRVKDAATYADYTLQPTVRAEQNLAVRDVAVSAATVSVAFDPKDMFTVAEDFEDINVTGTEGAYKEIPNQPFGKALWFGRSTDAVDATITFDE